MGKYAFYRHFPRVPMDAEPDFRTDVLARAKELGVFEKGMYTKSGRGDTRRVTIKLLATSDATTHFIEFVDQRALFLDEPHHPL